MNSNDKTQLIAEVARLQKEINGLKLKMEDLEAFWNDSKLKKMKSDYESLCHKKDTEDIKKLTAQVNKDFQNSSDF